MTHQQELELLAEWLGIEFKIDQPRGSRSSRIRIKQGDLWPIWNPSPEGNDTDFLNMVAGRVDFIQYTSGIEATICQFSVHESYKDHNNDKLAAMKHAAYQVCLMAAGEGKEEQNG